MPVNHLLSSREHLAEGAALCGEGRVGAAVRHLRAATSAAIAAMEEQDGASRHGAAVPLVAAARLVDHGISPDAVRDLMRELRIDCDGQARGLGTGFTAARVETAIEGVQVLVDLAAGVPAATSAAARGRGPGHAVLSPPMAWIPERPGPWLTGARRRRRRRVGLTTIVAIATLATVGATGVAAWIAGSGHPGREQRQRHVLSRTHELAAGRRAP